MRTTLFRLSLVLVIAMAIIATIAVSLTSAQTTQALQMALVTWMSTTTGVATDLLALHGAILARPLPCPRTL